MGKKEELFVTEDFEDAGVLGVDGDAVGFEVVEVGACGVASCSGVPPVYLKQLFSIRPLMTKRSLWPSPLGVTRLGNSRMVSQWSPFQ